MKMSITNSNRRRLSIVSFIGIFLFAVLIPCFAFIKSFKFQEVLSTELTALTEKEQILADFSQLSKALCKFDGSQRTNALSINKDNAHCNRLLQDLHTKLEDKDTTRIYKDVVSFVQMAEHYRLSIEQMGKQSDELVKSFQVELTKLRNKNSEFKNKITLLEVDKSNLLSEKGTLKTQNEQLIQTKNAKNQSADASSNSIPQPNDCDENFDQYKKNSKAFVIEMENSLKNIMTEVNNISGFLGIGKHKKEKENIQTHHKQFNESLEKLKSL